jgi:acyl-coenzyme A thioesterase PaaI-like protein
MAATAPAASKPAAVQSRSRCIVCGPDHPHGLRIGFDADPGGRAEADWTPTSDWEGYAGVIHGGIVSTVLDEAMSKAVAATGALAVTGELRVRYHAHVESGSTYRIRGWIVERKKRLFRTEATLITPSGEERAHAWGTFVEVPKVSDSAAQVEDPPRPPV